MSIARSAFTDGILPMLLNREGAFHGPGGELIGLNGVSICSSRQSGPPLWIVTVYAYTEDTALLCEFEWLL